MMATSVGHQAAAEATVKTSPECDAGGLRAVEVECGGMTACFYVLRGRGRFLRPDCHQSSL